MLRTFKINPKLNDATPTMDIYGLKKQLYRCTDANDIPGRKNKLCAKCRYRKAAGCWQRLMLDSAHAISLLLAERDEGKPLIVEGDSNEEEE